MNVLAMFPEAVVPKPVLVDGEKFLYLCLLAAVWWSATVFIFYRTLTEEVIKETGDDE